MKRLPWEVTITWYLKKYLNIFNKWIRLKGAAQFYCSDNLFSRISTQMEYSIANLLGNQDHCQSTSDDVPEDISVLVKSVQFES